MAEDSKKRSDESRRIEALIVTAAQGDRQAQQCLLGDYWQVIVGAVVARRRRMGRSTKGREETADIQQDAALRVLRELNQHRWQGRSAFAAWIRKLAGFEVVDAHRRNRAQKRDADKEQALSGIETAGAVSVEERLDQRRRFESIEKKLRVLKPEYRSAFVLRELGFRYAEIGETLGCSAEAARKLASRAKAQLSQG